MSTYGTVTIKPSKPRADRIINFAADPRRRGAAARLLNREAQGIVRAAREIAEGEFVGDRDESRRPEKNRGKPHYVDSFGVSRATQESLRAMKVSFGNSHPAAHIIENGAGPHEIPASRGKDLLFPFKPPPGSGRVNTPGGPAGRWPANFGAGAREAKIKTVNHPGSPAFHVFQRAVRRYKARSR